MSQPELGAMDASGGEDSPTELNQRLKRAYWRNALLAFVVMALLSVFVAFFPPARPLASYLRLIGYLVGGAAAGYYFCQELDRNKIGFETRYGVVLWIASSVALIVAIFVVEMPIRILLHGQGIWRAFIGVATLVFGQINPNNAGLVLALFGIAIGHDMYYEQFTMLRPLSREKVAEIHEFTSLVQPLSEARHRFGRSFTVDQLSELVPDSERLSELLSGLKKQGILEVSDGKVTITAKGDNVLSISRFIGIGAREEVEGADICAYCGRPLKLSDKLMRINYYGKTYVMHYSEREGVRIFGRLPYIDRVLGLKPAEISRPVYEKPNILPTVDHKASLALGISGAILAVLSYAWMMGNVDRLPIATEVSFFGGTLLSISLIFAAAGIIGGVLSYLNPGNSHGASIMIALLAFAAPFIGLTRQMVFGGYYASVALIAIGGVIALRAQTRVA